MNHAWRWLAFVAAIFLFNACGLDVDSGGGSSTVRIKLPEEFQAQGKVQAMSSSACFAISVIGSGINGVPEGACDPEYGQFYGLLKAGSEVLIEGLPKSDNHIIEIFYLSNSEGCAPFNPSAAEGLGKKFGTNRVHRIGSQGLGELRAGTNTVTVKVKLPNASNTLAALEIGDASCEIQGPPLAMLPNSHSQVVGAGYGTTATGKRVYLRVKSQNIESKQEYDFSGKLTPYRLGVQ